MGNPNLAGSVFDSAGLAVSGVTVNVYAAGDTATVIAATTTGAGGTWSIANSSVGNPDVELVNGTEITRFKFSDRIALTGMDAQSYKLRTSSGTSSFDLEILAPSAGFSQDLVFRVPDNVGSSEAEILTDAQFQTASNMRQGTTVHAYGAAASSFTDSSLANDPSLQFSIASATTYRVDLHSTWQVQDSVAAPILKFSVPTGATLEGRWQTGQTGSISQTTVTEASSVSIGGANEADSLLAEFQGFVTTTTDAGTFALQARCADAPTGSSNTLRDAGSWMSITKVSS